MNRFFLFKALLYIQGVYMYLHIQKFFISIFLYKMAVTGPVFEVTFHKRASKHEGVYRNSLWAGFSHQTKKRNAIAHASEDILTQGWTASVATSFEYMLFDYLFVICSIRQLLMATLLRKTFR